ncbi:radical SAM protein [Desulfolithobacter dissulfuricans]|uniref:Radical SAM protein n=1 Tax=Desulfolithobacter dissulfuricans TaxID=2795293 RepID=A0A915U1Z7_9BACT|nr:radical SAM protein [Desulfolithobacter dissulfuricans]BCO09863.1 radical SAM protein [Desulfolithobacter dissulfuricans]
MPSRSRNTPPSLVFANSRGEILDYDGLQMAGAAATSFYAPEPGDLIPLPEGSELFVLPGRRPVGIEPETGEPALLDTNPYEPGETVQAVAAFMAPAHTAIYTAAYQSTDKAPLLPLFAYTAVGWRDGQFWVAAFRSDRDRRQDADQFDQKTINRKTRKLLRTHPDNRLIQHLGKCCLTYGCPAARNYFLGRWEAPLPCSPVCNAACLGCISLQPSGCCPATQDRIKFTPSPAELAEIATAHLNKAPRPVVSFGQGCEGEPLLQAATMEQAIRKIRARTDRGTINLNTNASLPDAVARLAEAGLDSIRVSMNSAREEYHSRYYRPRGFDFQDVCCSITEMKSRGRHVSLNYFILPGFTDDPEEFEALCELIEERRPDLIQLRNLNMDPEHYLQSIGFTPSGPPLGIRHWRDELRRRFPWLHLGYFNPPLR